eukprot:511741-Prorocentrum_minimum.AAC.4
MSTAFLVRDSKLQVLRRLAGHAQSGLQPFAGCAAAVPFNQALRCEFAGMRGETLRREAALLEASGQHAELADAAERVRQQMRAEEAANQALQRQLVAAQEAAGTAATLQGALVTEALVALSEARAGSTVQQKMRNIYAPCRHMHNCNASLWECCFQGFEMHLAVPLAQACRGKGCAGGGKHTGGVGCSCGSSRSSAQGGASRRGEAGI